jgi:hypothetical protein
MPLNLILISGHFGLVNPVICYDLDQFQRSKRYTYYIEMQGIWPVYGQRRRGLYSLHYGPALIADDSAPHYPFLVAGFWRFRDTYMQWICPVLSVADSMCLKLANFEIPAQPEWVSRKREVENMLVAFSCHVGALDSALRAIDYGQHLAWAVELVHTGQCRQTPPPLELDLLSPLLVLRDHQIPAAETLLMDLYRNVTVFDMSRPQPARQWAAGGGEMAGICMLDSDAVGDYSNEQANLYYEATRRGMPKSELDNLNSTYEASNSKQPTEVIKEGAETMGSECSLVSEKMIVAPKRTKETPTAEQCSDCTDVQDPDDTLLDSTLPAGWNYYTTSAERDSGWDADDSCMCTWSVEDTCRILRELFTTFDDEGIRANQVDGRALLSILCDPARVILATLPVQEVRCHCSSVVSFPSFALILHVSLAAHPIAHAQFIRVNETSNTCTLLPTISRPHCQGVYLPACR